MAVDQTKWDPSTTTASGRCRYCANTGPHNHLACKLNAITPDVVAPVAVDQPKLVCCETSPPGVYGGHLHDARCYEVVVDQPEGEWPPHNMGSLTSGSLTRRELAELDQPEGRKLIHRNGEDCNCDKRVDQPEGKSDDDALITRLNANNFNMLHRDDIKDAAKRWAELLKERDELKATLEEIKDECESWPTYDELEHGMTPQTMAKYLVGILDLLPNGGSNNE